MGALPCSATVCSVGTALAAFPGEHVEHRAGVLGPRLVSHRGGEFFNLDVRLLEVRHERDRQLERGGGVVVVVIQRERLPQFEQRVGVRAVHAQRGPEFVDGIVIAALIAQDEPQVEVRALQALAQRADRVVPVVLDHGLERRAGLVEETFLPVRQPDAQERVLVGRVDLECFLVLRDGFIDTAGLHVGIGDGDPQRRVIRVGANLVPPPGR